MNTLNSHYKVGNTIFYSKTLALFEGTKLNVHPTWHFSDEIFAMIKWHEGRTENIANFYRHRAKQLREKYDYLVLMYSGGADSRTVLESFLSQGLTIDELLVCWPREITQGKYKVSTNTSASNMLSEYDLVIKPDLDYIAKYYPSIKITLSDWSTDVGTDTSELVENDWYSINDHLNPGVFKKYTVVTDAEKLVIESGKKSATIWGVDKPQIAYKDGNIYLYFLDKLANTRSSDNHNNRTSELFYWSPDMPELVHAQARLVYEYFIQHPEKLKLINWDDSSGHNKHELNLIIKSIIYPNWHPKRFQANKPTSVTMAEIDTWFFVDYKHTRYYQSWESGLKNIAKAVDPKYYQHVPNSNRFEGWVGFMSPFYLLGPAYMPIV